MTYKQVSKRALVAGQKIADVTYEKEGAECISAMEAAAIIDEHLRGYDVVIAAATDMLPDYEHLAYEPAGMHAARQRLILRMRSALAAAKETKT